MNQWFAHGQSVGSSLPPEECCSVCMKKCKAENSCKKCEENLKLFEPNQHVVTQAKSQPVVNLVKLMSELKLNENTPVETPPYDLVNLAEAMINNLLELKFDCKDLLKCKDLKLFEQYLELFSLGEEISKSLFDFVQSNLKELIEPNVDLGDRQKYAEEFSCELDCLSDHSTVSSDYSDDNTGDVAII